MSIDFKYDETRGSRVVIVTVGEMFTDAELIELNRRLYREVYDKATASIYQIMDGTRVKQLPRNILITSLQLYKNPHPKVGLTILVTSNAFAHSLLNVLVKFNSVRSSTVVYRTVAEALSEIDRRLSLEPVVG